MDLDAVDVECFEAGRFGGFCLQKGGLVSSGTGGFAGVLHTGIGKWLAAGRDRVGSLSA